MRRLRPALLILVTLVVALLFLGDFLTGREHHEFENPYSRTRKVRELKFGFEHVSIIPHPGMDELYYKQLKYPDVEQWEPSGSSYKVERFTGRLKKEDGPIAPIIFLKPDEEVDFLRSLPTDASRRAVLQSLFQPRKIGQAPDVVAYNDQLARMESERVRTISRWYQFDRNDFSISFPQWWGRNSRVFGIRPDGTPLVPIAAKPSPKDRFARKQP